MKKVLSTLIIGLLVSVNCYADNAWNKDSVPGVLHNDECFTAIEDNYGALDRVLANNRQGARLVYSSAAALTVEAGEVVVSNSGATVRVFTQNTSSISATTAHLDVGAAFVAATTYYVYAYVNATTTNTFSVLISANATTPTGGTYYKKLGSFYSNASSNITRILNDGFFNDFGAWVSKSSGTSYQATTDGFVVCRCTVSGTVDVDILVDDFTPPTTIRMSGSSGYGDDGVFCPVKKGAYYKVNKNAGGTASVSFMPSS